MSDKSINDESILDSIKALLGILDNDDTFNRDIVMHVNSVFSTLNQLGVGPEAGFHITGSNEKWEDFITNEKQLNVKTYIYIRVRLIFDPPQSSYVADLLKADAAEIEWRLTN